MSKKRPLGVSCPTLISQLKQKKMELRLANVTQLSEAELRRPDHGICLNVIQKGLPQPLFYLTLTKANVSTDEKTEAQTIWKMMRLPYPASSSKCRNPFIIFHHRCCCQNPLRRTRQWVPHLQAHSLAHTRHRKTR